jgi:polysaccharide export outer membrane protein
MKHDNFKGLIRKAGVTCILFCLAAAAAFSQQTAPAGDTGVGTAAPEVGQRLRLAISSGQYPVTPGDIYRLMFQMGDIQMIKELLVESSYVLDMNVFGKMNAAGMTFAQLKPAVEKIVSAAYPRSMPSLTISEIGIFFVTIKGDIPRSLNVSAWGLSRLGEIVEGKLGTYSSLRNVEIVSENGTKKQYDLFRAQIFGAQDQDPYVKPGDTVVIRESERTVEIVGEVKRPGMYQILAGEQLKDLVEVYGNGLTSGAQPTHLRVDRVSGTAAQVVYVDIPTGTDRGFVLKDGDKITITAKIDWLPTVSFEGAVVPQAAAAAVTQGEAGAAAAAAASPSSTYDRIVYPFKPGEMLSDALRSIRPSLAPMADLASVTLIRQGAPELKTLDAEQLLSGIAPKSDVALAANDRIVIPSLRFSVSVGGAVNLPGSFSYRAGNPAAYYIGLAGGLDMERNDNGDYLLFDSNGVQRKKTDAVAPGDSIYVPANGFIYNLNRVLPLLGTIISTATGTITLTLTIINMVQTP